MKCRICEKEISEGNICDKCLLNCDQELLTVDERKKKNKKIENKGCLSLIIVVVISGIFFLVGMPLIGLAIIIVGVLIVTSGDKKEICPKCQRRGTIQDISEQLVGTRETTMKEKKTVKKVRRNSWEIPEEYEIEEYVPVIEKTYNITYKCNKCGYLGQKTIERTVRK